MNDQPKKPTLTLIDVENGMYDLSLHTVLTPPCFTFFWGIIQTCNRLKPRFKNPFTLTVAQAMAAGGGVSRQAVWDKQQRLMKVQIDGEWLIRITPGSRKDNIAAKYKINYDLIVGQMVAIVEPTEQPSNIIDEQRTNSGRTADEPLTFLRSDQKREDKKEEKTVVPTPRKRGNIWEPEVKKELDSLAWQIIPIFDCVNPDIGEHARLLYSLLDYNVDDILDKIREAKGQIHTEEALRWVAKQMNGQS